MGSTGERGDANEIRLDEVAQRMSGLCAEAGLPVPDWVRRRPCCELDNVHPMYVHSLL